MENQTRSQKPTRTTTCINCREPFEVEVLTGILACFNSNNELMCDKCAELNQDEFEANQKRLGLESEISGLRNAGLVSSKFGNERFDLSDTAKEKANAEAWAVARQWKGEKNLYISGNSGTGKTYLARSCAYEAMLSRGSSVCEVSMSRVLKAARMIFNDRAREFFTACSSCNVLILDDVDKVAPSNSDFWELLNTRIDAGHRTIFTANVKLSDMYDFLGGKDDSHMVTPTLDRFKPVIEIEMTGKSFR